MSSAARFAGALLLGYSLQSSATIMTYHSAADFAAATTGLTTIDFNGIAPANGFVNRGFLSLSGVTFLSNSQMFVIDQGFYGGAYAGGGFLNSSFVPVNMITATLPDAATAIAMEFGGLFGPVNFTFDFSDGSSVTASSSTDVTNSSALTFIGFTSTVSLTSITLSMPDAPSFNAIDNFQFGFLAVPEPATLALLGLGLTGLGLSRHRVQ